jgi:hypothetical protein
MDDRDLDRFLDEFVSGRPAAADGVDPGLVAAARELRTLARAVATADSRARVDREVMAAIRGAEAEAIAPEDVRLIVMRAPEAVARPVPPPLAPPPTRRARGTWVANQAALAAILLLSLVGGYLSLVAGRIGGDETGSPSGVAAETLLDVVLPAGSMTAPAGANPGWHFVRFSLRPGRSLQYDPACLPDLIVGYVTDGSYVVRARGALQILRDGEEPEVVAAGEEVVLKPGDGYIYRNPGDDFGGFRNTAATRLVVDEWQWSASYCTANSPVLADVRWLTYGWGPLPLETTHPIRLRLRQMFLAPDAELHEGESPETDLLPAGTPGLEVIAAEPHFLEVTYLRPVPGGTPVTGVPVRQAWLSTLQVPVGTSRVVRNPTKRPLMLTILTLTEDGPSRIAT